MEQFGKHERKLIDAVPAYLSAKALVDSLASDGFNVLPLLHGFSPPGGAAPLILTPHLSHSLAEIVGRMRRKAEEYFRVFEEHKELLSRVAGRALTERDIKVIASIVAISDILERYTTGKGFETCRDRCQLDCDGISLLLMDALSLLGEEGYVVFYWDLPKKKGHAFYSTKEGLSVDPNLVKYAVGSSPLERAVTVAANYPKYVFPGPSPLGSGLEELLRWNGALVGLSIPSPEGFGLGWRGPSVFVGDPTYVEALYRLFSKVLTSRPAVKR